jgi:O-succinylbenzoate synthase
LHNSFRLPESGIEGSGRRRPIPYPESVEPCDGLLPGIEEILAAAQPVSIPMRVSFRGVTVRESVLVRGPAGWGEFCPFPEYDDAESVPWLRSAIEAAWSGFPQPLRRTIPVNATVPAVPAAGVQAVLERFSGTAGNAGSGISAVKIKVAEAGQDLAADRARVAEVRRLLPDAALRVDANGGWTAEEAVDSLTSLAEYGLEYAEQPAADIPGLRAVRTGLRRRGIPVPIAADESVRKESDPLLVAREDAADLLVIKAAPLGGVRRALRIADRAGLPAVVSSALETSVGISAGLALAAALPDLPHACGLGTVSLMAGDVTDSSLVPDGGALVVRPVDVSGHLLERFAADPGRRRWWLERVARCYRILASPAG